MPSPVNPRSKARGTQSAAPVTLIERTMRHRSTTLAAVVCCLVRCLAGVVFGVVVAGCAGPSGRPIVLDQAYAEIEAARGDAKVRALAPGRLDEAESALADAYLAWQRGAAETEVRRLAELAEERAALARTRAREMVAEARRATQSAAIGRDDLEADALNGRPAGRAPAGGAGPAGYAIEPAAALPFGREDGGIVPAAARSP